MAEMRTLINRKPLAYDGYFRLDELYSVIRRFARERGYFTIEKRSEEHALADGREIVLELELEKVLSDYARSNIFLAIRARGIKDKVVEIDKRKHKYNEGRVDILFSARLKTDWRGRWESSGFLFLFRTVMDKFIRHDVVHDLSDKAIGDCRALQEEVKAYLNMHRFKLETSPAKA